ncbi:MAG TPA: orotidine 5'-phosphate decarboxylase [bacterium]|nr:orotidine 5'-phosphate decarboxylase [bacterium]
MIIEQEKSIIPACDCDVELYERLVKETADLPGIGGYKIGFVLGLTVGIPRAVEIARRYTEKPIIYDHQKAGTDIPDTGRQFARLCKASGLNAVILFPQAGPETERAWIDFARAEDLEVIVGGLMTHKKYVRSEGGYIADEAIVEIYERAAGLGVNDYVVPGNNPEAIRKIRMMLEREHSHPVFYSPGFVAQGGTISDAVAAAGDHYHAFVGRGIYEAKDMRAAASELCKHLE